MKAVWVVLFIFLLAAAPAAPALPEARETPAEIQAAAGPSAAAMPPRTGGNLCRYFDRGLFARDITAAAYDTDGGVYAAIVPHHAPALDMAAALLKAAAEQGDYETVVVLGPDHAGRGGGIVLSGRAWDTPPGILDGDSRTQEYLLGDPAIGARADHEIITGDHAEAILMPYIKHFLPDVKVTALLIGRGAAPARLSALAAAIHDMAAGRRVLVLASIDFSHFQSPEETRAYDAATIAAVEAGDIAALLAMDGRLLDSPECAAVLLELGALAGLSPRLLEHRTRVYHDNDTGRPAAMTYMAYAWEQAPPNPVQQ